VTISVPAIDPAVFRSDVKIKPRMKVSIEPSVRQLTGALAAYPGALLVASHDVAFLSDLGITRWLLLDGELTSTSPL